MNEEQAKKRTELIEFVIGESMSPDYYAALPTWAKQLVDKTIDACYSWYRAEIFRELDKRYKSEGEK